MGARIDTIKMVIDESFVEIETMLPVQSQVKRQLIRKTENKFVSARAEKTPN
jgi:hypothetical protein